MNGKNLRVIILLVAILSLSVGSKTIAQESQVIAIYKSVSKVIEPNDSFCIPISGKVSISKMMNIINKLRPKENLTINDLVVKVYVEPQKCPYYLQDLEGKQGDIASDTGDWEVYSNIGLEEQDKDIYFNVYAVVVRKADISKLKSQINNFGVIGKLILCKSAPIKILRKATKVPN